MSEARREALVAAARAMAAAGLSPGTSGNLSVRDGDGLLVTPSGLSYDHLGPEDVVALGPNGQPTGPGKPTSEWRIHRDIYRERRDVSAIVHAHPPHATALACLHFDLPAFHYEVAFGGGKDIRCADYATFGTQALSDNVLKALEGRRAALMANHGMVALGDDPAAALALAEKVEALSRVYVLCLGVREPQLLGETEMRRVLERFKDYGA